MSISFHEVLFNVLIACSPVIVSPFFDESNPLSKKSYKPMMTLVSILAALALATYPYSSGSGIKQSLFMLPLVSSFLHGGLLPALSVSASLLLLHGFVFPALLPTDAVFLLICACFAGFYIKFHKIGGRFSAFLCPVLLSAGLGFTFMAFQVFFHRKNQLPLPPDFFSFHAFSIVLHGISMAIIIYLSQFIRESRVNRLESQRAEKLNVLSELAASVAHEIRNPMTVARGFLQILSQTEVNEEKKKMYTSMAIEEMDRVQQIITSYLAFAKPQAEITEPVSVSGILVNLVQRIQGYAGGSKVQLETHAPPSLWITANAEKLIQCLVNLSRNGIEAMPEGGRLRIEAYPEPKSVCISIEDTGIGMNAEEIARLGSPFYSTKQKGTGLSVMVAFRIIETFSGKVQVTSVPGRGTRVLVTLPQAAKPPQLASAQDQFG
ncbi:two-component sensor histidine kinase [Paenibacillus chitinolyticus]|uniref:histidine kinase n=1 Tax=Paenibacillus chitinolyticus TaxID=79263 RepID=A0A410X1U0_9BACL|nr:ATP-binding protein [Paenibacillus chitinolyticus]MCY9592668.1 ATP-binding protein [Paenibacillus chitinolyticus]MCY9594729.1 ATP-binding protein [Paenibacillus chitinolyticus]QAV20579.1 two-component sensor histidine kinase [Paenibacillus chitinolyticus]